jgi:hypothetical protein
MFKKQNSEVELDNLITKMLVELQSPSTSAQDFATTMDYIERLTNMKKLNSSDKINRDTMAIVVGNLAGIGLIVGFERANVLTSKAINFVMKAR